jgi:hypothetical protein
MHMIFLHMKRTSHPGVRFAETMDFLFDKQSKLANQNLFPILGAPDKVIGQFIRDVVGVLCVHTQLYNMCSTSCEVPERAALPLDES